MSNDPAAKTVINFDDIEPHHRYTISSGLIVPRPIGWIGSASSSGRQNLAPYSFFNLVNGHPPTFVVAPYRGKDTPNNIIETGEFSVNVVTEETVGAMNASAATVGPEVDEFELAGVTAAACVSIAAPRVAEAVATFECQLTQTVDIGGPNADGESGGVLFVGVATHLHLEDRLIDGHHIKPEELRAVGRHAGPNYNTTADSLFQLERPA